MYRSSTPESAVVAEASSKQISCVILVLSFICFVPSLLCRQSLDDQPVSANSDIFYFPSKSVFCFAFRLEWHWLMMPVLLLFRMGKLGQIGCTFQCCFCIFYNTLCTLCTDFSHQPIVFPTGWLLKHPCLHTSLPFQHTRFECFITLLNDTTPFLRHFSIVALPTTVACDLIADVVTGWCFRCRTHPGCLTKPTLCSTR